MRKPILPDYHVFHGPIAGMTVVAGETLSYLRAEADRRGVTLDQLWVLLVAEEEDRIQRHLEKN